MKKSLGQLLGPDSAEGGGCPDANLLAAFVENRLIRQELRSVETHLAECGKCRRELLYAAIPEVEAAKVASEAMVHSMPPRRTERLPLKAPPSRLIGVRLALRNAIGAIVSLFEGTLDPAAVQLRGQPPVFRGDGPEIEWTNTVTLGPYRLSLRRIEEGPNAGLYVRVTRTMGMPLTDAAAEIELESGRHLTGRTDALGWVYIAGIELEHINSISIDAET